MDYGLASQGSIDDLIVTENAKNDCVGPTGQKFDTNYTVGTKIPGGNWMQFEVPGNEVGCKQNPVTSAPVSYCAVIADGVSLRLDLKQSQCNPNYCDEKCVKIKLALAHPPFCNDFEYIAQDQCVNVNTEWNSNCPGKRLKTGQCVAPMEKCNTGFPYLRQYRATTNESCSMKGLYCVMDQSNHDMEFGISRGACISKGGIPGNYYAWITPGFVNVGKPSWITENIQTTNIWANQTSLSVLENLLMNYGVSVLTRVITNQYQRFYNVYLAAFKCLACNCMESSTCKDSSVTATLQDCITGYCGGAEFPLNFVYGTVSFKARFHSVGNFIAPTIINTVSPLAKRCNPIQVYETVQNSNGQISGQMIGNGESYSLDFPFLSPFNLCLQIDQSIQQNTALYQSYGIAVAYIILK